MVDQPQAQELGPLIEALGEAVVLARWRGVAPRVVVGDEESWTAMGENGGEEEAGLCRGAGEGARRGDQVAGDPVLDVGQEEDEDLARLVAEEVVPEEVGNATRIAVGENGAAGEGALVAQLQALAGD